MADPSSGMQTQRLPRALARDIHRLSTERVGLEMARLKHLLAQERGRTDRNAARIAWARAADQSANTPAGDSVKQSADEKPQNQLFMSELEIGEGRSEEQSGSKQIRRRSSALTTSSGISSRQRRTTQSSAGGSPITPDRRRSSAPQTPAGGSTITPEDRRRSSAPQTPQHGPATPSLHRNSRDSGHPTPSSQQYGSISSRVKRKSKDVQPSPLSHYASFSSSRRRSKDEIPMSPSHPEAPEARDAKSSISRTPRSRDGSLAGSGASRSTSLEMDRSPLLQWRTPTSRVSFRDRGRSSRSHNRSGSVEVTQDAESPESAVEQRQTFEEFLAEDIDSHESETEAGLRVRQNQLARMVQLLAQKKLAMFQFRDAQQSLEGFLEKTREDTVGLLKEHAALVGDSKSRSGRLVQRKEELERLQQHRDETLNALSNCRKINAQELAELFTDHNRVSIASKKVEQGQAKLTANLAAMKAIGEHVKDELAKSSFFAVSLRTQPCTDTFAHGVLFDVFAKKSTIVITGIKTACHPRANRRPIDVSVFASTRASGSSLVADSSRHWMILSTTSGKKGGVCLPAGSIFDAEPSYGTIPLRESIRVEAGTMRSVALHTNSRYGLVLRKQAGLPVGARSDADDNVELRAGWMAGAELFREWVHEGNLSRVKAVGCFVGELAYRVLSE